jgi:hypothetical protein
MEPPLSAPAPGAKVTIAQDPVEDPEKIKKVRLEFSPFTPSDEDGELPEWDGGEIEICPEGCGSDYPLLESEDEA